MRSPQTPACCPDPSSGLPPYEDLINYFADSAGKKGGEFSTPAEVVRLLVPWIEPKVGRAIDDPTGDSGGRLLPSTQDVPEVGGDPRNRELAGEALPGAPGAIGKRNLRWHGIRSAALRQGDTLPEPLPVDRGPRNSPFRPLLAHPRFSQNYRRERMKFKDRFRHFMPESAKKADHRVASLKCDGKRAAVMPQGVLVLGSEAKACRQRFIKDGILEAVLGLPSNRF